MLFAVVGKKKKIAPDLVFSGFRSVAHPPATGRAFGGVVAVVYGPVDTLGVVNVLCALTAAS